ncbi:MAG: hypothetical protein GTN65_08605 [Armatimonadetes bacterium]|nr:hypothetical protein [Armatimonadota bacterium]NIO97144.1 hypothetical protein [Armatimonadota bacterium]
MKAIELIIVAVLIFGAGCTQQPPTLQLTSTGEAFFVHLQEGFSGEFVRVVVDGKEVFSGKPTTDPRLGFAEQFAGSAQTTSITLTVEIPSKTFKSTHSLDLTKARGIGISIVNGEVMIIQANAFGYD